MVVKATITLAKSDYLAFALFEASKSKKLKKNRILWWGVLTIACLILLIYFYRDNDGYNVIVFVIATLYFLCYYPFTQKKRLLSNIEHSVEDNYQYFFNKESFIEITKDVLRGVDQTGEELIYTKEIKEIVETKDYIFVRYKSPKITILPKSKFILVELLEILNAICFQNNIQLIDEQDWKWGVF